MATILRSTKERKLVIVCNKSRRKERNAVSEEEKLQNRINRSVKKTDQTSNLKETRILKIESTTQFPSVLANVRMRIHMIYRLPFHACFMDRHDFHRIVIIKLLHSRNHLAQ